MLWMMAVGDMLGLDAYTNSGPLLMFVSVFIDCLVCPPDHFSLSLR